MNDDVNRCIEDDADILRFDVSDDALERAAVFADNRVITMGACDAGSVIGAVVGRDGSAGKLSGSSRRRRCSGSDLSSALQFRKVAIAARIW